MLPSSEIEVWKQVAFAPSYEVSESGVVRRLISCNAAKAGKVIKPTIDKDGYHKYSLSVFGTYRQIMGHKLVALTFLGPQPSAMHQVAHNDGSRTNNHWSNLRWATPKENQADRALHGTRSAGERSGSRKLTQAAVNDIRDRYFKGEKSGRQLAEIHGVSRLQIANIVTGRQWTDESHCSNPQIQA